MASLRPTLLTSFFDRLHITLDSFFTGSRSQDLTHKLEGSELERHKAHVDEMYADFKNRVVDGRGIHPELIDLIAGGRVMTGLKAFTLNAPPELIDRIKGLDAPVIASDAVDSQAGSAAATSATHEKLEKSDALPAAGAKDVVASSPLESGEGVKRDDPATNKGAIVELSEDQDMSPYAPPELATPPFAVPGSTSSTDSQPVSVPGTSLPTASNDPAEVNAQVALATSTPQEQQPPTPPSSSSSTSGAGTTAAAGIYEVKPGPFGRGLVDGIGGIRDAAVYACELFVSPRQAAFPARVPARPAELTAYVSARTRFRTGSQATKRRTLT